MKRLTILDVAERAGVSVGTVSNALNRPEIVAEKTLASVQAAMEVEKMTIGAGEDAAEDILAGEDRPTAVFCTNDLLALGLEHALIAAGFRVPEDFAIVGYDDVAFATMAFVPMTSVRQPAYELGHRAARQLLSEAGAEAHTHEQVVFEPELVVRASTEAAVAAPVPGPAAS